MPILGILASSVPAAAGDYESIATVTVGSGGAANVEFTSIPSTYTHLQLRSLIRGTNSSSEVETRVTFNSDTSANYASHQIYGTGSVVPVDGETNSSYIYYLYSPANNATASVFGGAVMDILDYGNTNKYKTTRTLAGFDANGSGYILFRSGHWRNTAAITSIKIVCASNNFAQYSHFALYGIKVAS
jgi:hypothetical protein